MTRATALMGPVVVHLYTDDVQSRLEGRVTPRRRPVRGGGIAGFSGVDVRQAMPRHHDEAPVFTPSSVKVSRARFVLQEVTWVISTG